MRKKTILIRLLKVLSLLLALVCFAALSQAYLFRISERDTLRIDGYRLEEKDSLDVVLLGASEIYTAFSPALAYEQYGFTSYPYAVASGPVTLWQTMLEDALAAQTPQLIVVEVNGAVYRDAGSLRGNTAMHYVLDGMPLSAKKIRAVRSLCGEGTDSPACFIFPIAKYHTAWRDAETLERNYSDVRLQKQRGFALLRGISTTARIAAPKYPVRDVSADYSQQELAPEAEQALRDFLAYCREKELNVLFVRFPHRIQDKENCSQYRDFQIVNRAAQIIEESGFPFLNLERCWPEIGLDPDRDFYNDNHMNIYGQEKLTSYFAGLLVDRCGVTPRAQSAQQRAAWTLSAECYQVYRAYAEDQTESDSGIMIAENAVLAPKLEALR